MLLSNLFFINYNFEQQYLTKSRKVKEKGKGKAVSCEDAFRSDKACLRVSKGLHLNITDFKGFTGAG